MRMSRRQIMALWNLSISVQASTDFDLLSQDTSGNIIVEANNRAGEYIRARLPFQGGIDYLERRGAPPDPRLAS
jgi:hypothetical protein